ncbi:MAG: SMI1/KNR4 family protein [Verrucomicrobia bacterium]|nr:SMI1/KNR4 family protein [Verrucomicrobiota bacterium]
MKYTRYINLAIDHLNRNGIEYEILQGEMVSIEQIRDCEETIGFSLPREYREYLFEIGDGFSLSYETPMKYLEERILAVLHSDSSKQHEALKSVKNGHRNRWRLDSIADTISEWECTQKELSEESIKEYLKWNGEEYLNECRRRRRWFPISGIGGGGRTINIDCNTDSGSIRYHDIRNPGNTNSTYIAHSLEFWMANWSQYTFSDPTYSYTTQMGITCLCDSLDGEFPWADSSFLPKFRIANI